MDDRTAQLVKPAQSPLRKDNNPSRIFPLAIAGIFCFLVAVLAGTFSWYFLWLPFNRPAEAAVAEPVQSLAVTETPAPEPEPPSGGASAPLVETPPALPAGLVAVPGGEVVLTGTENRPVERAIVDQFAISETEVTNGEYSEFIRETKHAPPPGWSGHKFPADTSNFPVVNVSWKDAVDFCTWKAGKLGMTVRLPTEAEWELAARGPERLKYPWGAEWNKDAAASKETGGKVSAVKSFSINRSSVGAYDMVGNVWEWISDEIGDNESVSDADAESARKQGRRLRIVKGGSAEESSKDMNAESRYEVPDGTKVKVIGFRYVVVPKNPS